MECLSDRMRSTKPAGPMLVVGHLAHLLPVDRILLLRCDPSLLERRLRLRGDPPPSIQQNIESELTDLILVEAVESGHPVYERDVSREDPTTTARWILKVLTGREAPSHGAVDWLSGDVRIPQSGGG